MSEVSAEQIMASESAMQEPAAPETQVPAVDPGPTETVAEEQEHEEQEGQEPAPSEGEPARQKPKGGFQRRIDSLTGDLYQERREKEQLLAIVNRLSGKGEAEKPANAPKGEPQREDYQSFEEWQVALNRHVTKETFREEQERAQSEQNEQAKERQLNQLGTAVAANHERSISEFVKTHPDYDEVVNRDDVVIPNSAGVLIHADPKSAAIFYTIAKNPQLAERLQQFDGNIVMQANLIGRIAASISSQPQVSAAPAPGKPVGAKAATSGAPSANSSMDDYMAWRNKQGFR